MVIAVATDLGLKMKQIDVKIALTQVALPDGEDIYLRPLPSLKGPEGEGRVLKLLHHLYVNPFANAAVSRHSHKVGFQGRGSARYCVGV
jgi:hypothetical protein